MENFFAKKGIGLSKNQNTIFAPPRQQMLRSSESITWNQYSQNSAIRPSTDFSWVPTSSNPSVTFSPPIQQSFQKTDYSLRLPPNPPKILKQGFSINPTKRKEACPPHTRKSSDLSGVKRSLSRQNLLNINKDIQAPSISTQCKTSASFINKPNQYDVDSISSKQIRSLLDVINNKRETNQYRPISMSNLQTNEEKDERNVTSFAKQNMIAFQKEKEEMIKREKEMHLMRQQQEQKRRERQDEIRKQERNKRDRSDERRRERSEEKKKQIQNLSAENKQFKNTSSFWIQEKITLKKQLDQKDKKIYQLEKRLTDQQRESKTKIMMLEYEVKKLKELISQLQNQNQNSRKLLQLERSKNDKAQEQKAKLIFFEEDLIHAKDFDRLKQQLDQALNENAKMFQDHQKYIIEVSQMRRTYTEKIQELQDDIVKLKYSLFSLRDKIQGFGTSSDEKMMLIKMQSEINFLLKKGQQNMKSLIEKEEKLEEARLQIKEIQEKNNRDNENHQTFMEGMNLHQLLDTVTRYENRISDMSERLEDAQIQIEKQKKMIETLSSQLRQAKEDRKITSLKEKSNENILKNEVTALQQSLQSEIQIRCKKIAALEEKFQRKSKESEGKDKFIKEFLLNRVKEIEKSNVQEIVQIVNRFLNVEEVGQEVAETAQSQEVTLQSEGTVDL